MTISEAATLHGVSPQAIYKRLSKNGHDIKTLKNASGALTEEGERIIEQLFDRTSVTGEGDPAPQQTRKAAPKKEDSLLLHAQKEAERLKNEVDNQLREIDLLKREVDSLRDERDYLRRALDQAQQLHAMTMKQMLPPAPAERHGVLSWLTSRFKKPAPDADQSQTADHQQINI